MTSYNYYGIACFTNVSNRERSLHHNNNKNALYKFPWGTVAF